MNIEGYNINIFSQHSCEISFYHLLSKDKPYEHFFHINDFYEFYIYISGNADYIVQHQCYQLEYGDIIVLNPNELHKVLLKEEGLYERFYICFPPAAFHLLDSTINSPMDCFKNRNLEKMIRLPENQRNHAVKLLYQISDFTKDINNSSMLLAYSCLLQLLQIIVDTGSYTLPIGSPACNLTLPTLISDVLMYINDKFYTGITATDIASRFYVSLPYLSTTFKKFMNMTLTNYICALKISKAKALLRKGYSVNDTYYECGFNDCSYFIRTFKKFVGNTPFRYRNDIYDKKYISKLKSKPLY